ncbi:alpha/beta fold hydrolase [Aquiflexum gelatinilyticum]|uniref:Alpha/beta fold hydrolase n=1 Tax=Aquiflexum gelatinilyticum TaxID=2961943 RepID=A0A9X2P9V5_9BACT|nr:alpha/beta fold hydrolase [Aquiflexum gelatinilyticum]MCR9017008.1 alpha/beta fold hydrolase [Aquiflexum gelatinilyticum]
MITNTLTSLSPNVKKQSDWLDKNEYPFPSQFFEIGNQKLHFIDEGNGELLLFVHGTPSWSFDFRNVIKSMSKTHRCIAIDHIGFGLSDKPKVYEYSTQNHSKTLEKFILEKDLSNITMIVHDFGGPIGLDVAIRHPERFTGFVILNSWLWSSETEPDYIKLKKILNSPLLPFLYRQLNFSPRLILPGSFGEKKLNRKLKLQYIKPFANSSERNGALAFAYSLRDDQSWFEELWQKKSAIQEKPVLFIWGMKDPVIKHHNLEKFQGGFPNHRTLKIASAGHFPQEEEPKMIIDGIKVWLNESQKK